MLKGQTDSGAWGRRGVCVCVGGGGELKRLRRNCNENKNDEK